MWNQQLFGLLLLAFQSLPLSLSATAQGPSTSNFVVRAADASADEARGDCERLAKRCESWRSSLFKHWQRSSGCGWNPRCDVVIHYSQRSYRAHVGEGSAQTTGSSLIKSVEGRIVQRRIDLLADPEGRFSALPHELTHVVLADLFGGQQPPPWFNEGIATLADPEAKRSLHHRDCLEALESGTAFRVAELFALYRLSSPNEVAAFYGQSLSLTHFLVERNEPHELVNFVKHALDVGYDRALQKHYGFDSMADLEDQWRRSVRTNKPNNEEPSENATVHDVADRSADRSM